ncbi:MAG: hypothetical protein GX989_04800, partial [Firmicutes bacterium]|nr:hypothetical protein [Bacillota bacterium]
MNSLKDDAYQRQRTNFHLIPGRLRVGIPSLLNDQNLAFQLAHRFSEFPGVRMSYANPVTGQVLINFDPYETDLKLLLSWIYYVNGNNPEAARNFVLFPPKTRGSVPLKQQMSDIQVYPRGKPIPWHLLGGSKALAFLESSAETGLSHHSARMRLEKFGANELEEGQKRSFLQIALESLGS